MRKLIWSAAAALAAFSVAAAAPASDPLKGLGPKEAQERVQPATVRGAN